MNIFVNDSSFFAAPYLAEALECDLYVLNTTPKYLKNLLTT